MPPDGRKASTERARPTPGGRTEHRASQRPRRTDNPPQAWRSPPNQPNRAQRGGHAAPERGARRRPDKASRGEEGGPEAKRRGRTAAPAKPDQAANAAKGGRGRAQGGGATPSIPFEFGRRIGRRPNNRAGWPLRASLSPRGPRSPHGNLPTPPPLEPEAIGRLTHPPLKGTTQRGQRAQASEAERSEGLPVSGAMRGDAPPSELEVNDDGVPGIPRYDALRGVDVR